MQCPTMPPRSFSSCRMLCRSGRCCCEHPALQALLRLTHEHTHAGVVSRAPRSLDRCGLRVFAQLATSDRYPQRQGQAVQHRSSVQASEPACCRSADDLHSPPSYRAPLQPELRQSLLHLVRVDHERVLPAVRSAIQQLIEVSTSLRQLMLCCFPEPACCRPM